MEPTPSSGDINAGNINVGQGNVHVGPVYHQHPAPSTQHPPFIGVPGLPAHELVGRDAQLAMLRARLLAGENMALAALAGMGGVGKTTLAAALAHDNAVRAHFADGVLWASLGKQPDVLAALAAWGEALGRDVTRYPNEAERAQAVRDAIGQRRMLLVVDDAWSQEAALRLRCGGPACAHLLTTRDQTIAAAFAGAARVALVPTLDDADAWALLQALAPAACAADPDAARALAQAVGGLPLALELLGGFLAAPEHSRFPKLAAGALAEMRDPARRLRLATERLGSRDGRRVQLGAIIALSLTDLPEGDSRAFHALGAFAPKPATFDSAAAEAVSEADAATLARLIARSLLEQEGDTLALHQLLHDFARQLSDPDAPQRHRAHYLALANADRKDWRRIEAAYPQLQWAWAHLPDAAVLDYVGALSTYQGLRGLGRDKFTWYERGLRVAQQQGRRKDEANLLNNIGLVHDNLGQRREALGYYERALPIQEEVGDRAGLAVTLTNIGSVYVNLGKLREALGYYERALPIMEEVGDRAGLAVTLNNIGAVYNALGQRREALGYFERALPIQEEVGDRAGLAVTLNNIGAVYRQLGQLREALGYYERALPIQEEVGDRYGERYTHYNISVLHYAEGRLAEAVAQLRRVVALDEQVEHPDLEDDRAMLARVEAEFKAEGEKTANG